MAMTINETANLYIKHADAFRTLLNEKKALCRLSDNTILYYDEGQGLWLHAHGGGLSGPRAALAVAAMTEAWRERLNTRHNIWFETDDSGTWHDNGPWKPTGQYWASLPEAICARVEALAAEKRAEEVAECDQQAKAKHDAELEQAVDRLAALDKTSRIARRAAEKAVTAMFGEREGRGAWLYLSIYMVGKITDAIQDELRKAGK